MGAALTSHGLDDPQHRQLLTEYISHSRKDLDECAQIFRGSVGKYDDDDEFDRYNERTTAVNKRGANGASQSVYVYPRHVHFEQFEEVFGMLVADADPHFEFFQEAEETETACAHQVFCAIALMMKADLHAKVTFILRLYADQVGQLSSEKKRLAVKDFLLALQLILNLTDEIPSEVTTVLEKSFWAENESKLMSVREVYDICFTSPHVSGFLHDIQTLVEEFTADLERELQRSHSTHAQSVSPNSSDTRPVDKSKMLTRTASTFFIPQDSLLWTLKARDYSHFWQQTHVELRSNVTCAHALREMASADTEIHAVMVFESTGAALEVRVYSGLLSTGNFLHFFLHFLPPEPTNFHVERAIRKFGASTLRDVLLFNGKMHRFQCIDEDEAFFNVLLRFARGAESVAVVVADAMEHPNSLLLGNFTVLNLLEWVEEDLTLFNGKEFHALRAFPSYFYAPASVNATLTSVCDGFASMSERGLAGILVTFKDNSASKVLSINAFRDFFTQSYDIWAGVVEKESTLSPLLCSLGEITRELPTSRFVSPESSIASVIREMVDARCTRVFIRKEGGAVVGVMRATDIFLLLLKEQHASSAHGAK